MGKRKLRSDDKKARADSTPHAPQAAILEQLQQISAQVQGLQQQMNDHVQGLGDRLDGLQNRFDGLENRLDVTDAGATADRQRLSNFRRITLSTLSNGDLSYVPVVKYIPGHPFLPHPDLDGVEFAQDYPVGSQPPPNLLPTNYDELSYKWSNLTQRQMRQRLQALFWFYNDHRFQLPSNATKELCRATLQSLHKFLREP